MKRYINIFCAAAAVLSFAACEKTVAPEAPVEEVLVGNVELSSIQVVFPVDGGTKTVLVNANGEWYYDCDYTWLSISANPEENSVTFTADENTTGKTRYGVVSVICGDKGYTDCRDIKVVQVSTPVSLAADGETANCYITAPGVTYKFPATVKGNGKGDGNSKYIETCGVEINGAAYAELVWEATLDGDRTRSTYVIDGEPVFDGGNVYFTTGTEPGNAVIAVCDVAGEILWSWHIWVSAEEIATKTDDNGLVWMDRNLGALSVVPSEVQNTRGLFYQWGRKDPFLPSVADFVEIPTIYSTDDANTKNAKYAEQLKLRPSANVNNEQKGNGKRGISTEEAIVTYHAPGNMTYSVANPEKFISIHSVYTGGIKCDWYIMDPDNTTDEQSASNLWGNTATEVNYKTIFDPCPAGYAVPKSQAFGTINADLGYSQIGVDFDEAGNKTADNWTEDENGYGFVWNHGGNNAYFPKSGSLGLFGSPQYACEEMLYWAADIADNELDGWGRANCLFMNGGYVYVGIERTGQILYDPSGYGARAYGANVRCVKE